MSAFVLNLARAMAARGLRRRDLCRLCDIPLQTVGKWFSRGNVGPDPENLRRLCEGLGTTPGSLVGDARRGPTLREACVAEVLSGSDPAAVALRRGVGREELARWVGRDGEPEGDGDPWRADAMRAPSVTSSRCLHCGSAEGLAQWLVLPGGPTVTYCEACRARAARGEIRPVWRKVARTCYGLAYGAGLGGHWESVETGAGGASVGPR